MFFTLPFFYNYRNKNHNKRKNETSENKKSHIPKEKLGQS